MKYSLYSGARLRFDRARDQHVLLKPEEVTELNATAFEILELCQETTEAEIIAALTARYPQADPAELTSDVREFLQEALDTQWLRVEA